MPTRPPKSLHEMIDRLEDTAEKDDRITLGMVVDALGRRSFAPLLLLAGLLATALGGIPGVPTLVGVLVALTAGQLLMHRESFWLPHWMTRRSISREHMQKMLHYFERPARWVDKWLRPRWTALTQKTGRHAIAVLCLIIAAALPPMEFIPFSSHGVGAALLAFGVALITHDGLVEVVAMLLTIATGGLVAYTLLVGG